MTEALPSPASLSHMDLLALVQSPLASGWTSFDDLRLVRAGRLVLFDVAPPAAPAASRFLADLVEAAGAEASVVVEAPGVEPVPGLAEAVGGRVARPRTKGGLLSMLEGPLPELLASEPIRLVIVTGLPEACVGARRRGAPEGRAWLAYALARLRDAARTHGAAVVVVTSALSGRPSHALRELLREGVDEMVAVLPAAQGGLRFVVPARGVAVQAAASSMSSRTGGVAPVPVAARLAAPARRAGA